MASSSSHGAAGPGMLDRQLSRRLTRAQTMLDDKDPTADSELVPSSLASIVPILRVANEIEEQNPRVAYLCRFHAFEKAHKIDANSTGRGVKQFKTYLLHRLENDDIETKRTLARSDPSEIQKFYQQYYETYLREGSIKRPPDEMAKHYQNASILYDVLTAVVPDDKVKNYAREVETKKPRFAQYNILPLQVSDAPIMEIPGIRAAVNALRNLGQLHMAKADQTTAHERTRSIHDLLDWLGLAFGFQRGNVENQREHLILLLANIDARKKHHLGEYSLLDKDTIGDLRRKIFKNYHSWCDYLHLGSNLRVTNNAETQQLDLLYIGLYLLIWGEASNVRFMPECLCYIFHNMARELHGYVVGNVPIRDEGYFLNVVIHPIYNVLYKEVLRNKKGTASHSKWRNYDDLNEYFWSKACLKLGWPMDPHSEFFINTESISSKREHSRDQVVYGRRKPKTNFVEVRTFWHLFRSFDRMWSFFILAFQAMLIIAWSPSGSLSAIFDADVFGDVLSIFITASLLNLLQAALDIMLSWKAWGTMAYTQIMRYILKFCVATAWVIILVMSYSGWVQNPSGLIRYLSNWIGNWRTQSLYSYAIAIYLIPNILGAVLFLLPPLHRFMERSNRRLIVLLMWWAQPKLYVARGMHESLCSLLRYTMFWILLLICKLAFSFYVEISPLVEPTKTIMKLGNVPYEWHDFFPHLQHNFGVVITIWAPVVMVYFMDTQIWYAIFSTIFGGINGAFSHLGEIRTLGMLRSRFKDVPDQFSKNLVPNDEGVHRKSEQDEIVGRNIANFSHIWNDFIMSLREEDLISNIERDLLLVPSSSNNISVVQWPPFLLASKIPAAVDTAKDFNKKGHSELEKKIENDSYMCDAVIECYQTLRDILYSLLKNKDDKEVVRYVCAKVDDSIRNRQLLMNFRMNELPQLSTKVEKLLTLLKKTQEMENPDTVKTQITNVLQDTMDIILQDIMINENSRVQRTAGTEVVNQQEEQRKKDHPQFSELDLELMKNKDWMEKVTRLHLLVTVKESASRIPTNLDARRRITFFANSLFMTMPNAPKIHNMTSFSVLTPYYNENVMYSEEEINQENEDGISILFYLKKIYPDEWENFLERNPDHRDERVPLKEQPENQQDPLEKQKERIERERQWTSYRGQTLARTVRGMMYYKRALELQCFLDMAGDRDILRGYRTIRQREQYQDEYNNHLAKSSALADIKFTYVVSCQIYGQMKASKESRDRLCYQNILALMTAHRSLRVAYIDERDEEEEVNGKSLKVYYSVLVKGGDRWDEEIYRIKLPGKPTAIGEGKPENQNHAIIFTRGEALQAIDMNQDNYLEEAFKVRNVLEEFHSKKYGKDKPTILGLRENIFTGSVSSLAWFMSNQETSFVTIGQRVLANPLKVRFHYGHPDIFDRLFHITRGGISKASKIINLSEDIFAGYNSTMRGGNVTHHEYIQVGKGRDVGMNQISQFEAKVANGNGEQTLSRDVCRLGRRFDFYRMLSFYFTTVGFYFSSMLTVLTVYVFLYGRLYLVMSGLERSILEDPRIQQNIKPLENALASQSVVQLGLLLVLPMVMEIGLEKGFHKALGEFILMQLQLASVFFTFQLGTKAHYYGRTILHGGAKYRSTGRGFVVYHAKFADNYRMYSRSHFVKGLELLILLVVYQVYSRSYHSSTTYLFVTISIWFLVASWLFAPFAFNPSCLEWQKTVDDWTDWLKWMGNQGGIGIQPNLSWESWWEEEQEHLKTTSIRGRILEILLSLRFLIYQYGIVYHLHIVHGNREIWVYAVSWLVMITVLIVLKMASMGRRRFNTDTQLMFRILKGLLFLSFLSVLTVLFVVFNLTISDVFASILGFMPTGWCILLLGQACRPLTKNFKLWESIKELGRAYEYVMGIIIFLPIAILSWFPFMSEFQTRLLFNQAFSRGLQISRILAGGKESNTPS
ncbi:callose synthase 7-like [Carex rostrata]